MHENRPPGKFQKLFRNFCTHSFTTSSCYNYYVQIHNLLPQPPNEGLLVLFLH